MLQSAEFVLTKGKSHPAVSIAEHSVFVVSGKAKEAAGASEGEASESYHYRQKAVRRIMTIQECYQRLGGDYAQVEARLCSARLVQKFIGKFLEDGSFLLLCSSMEAGNREEAFRAAHTLKGICQNLGFDRLQESTSRLTELLRPAAEQIPAGAAELLEAVREDYGVTAEAIREYLSAGQ